MAKPSITITPDEATHWLGAIMAGPNQAIIENLIKCGADVNAVHFNNYTALDHAAYDGDVEIVKKLLEAGANPKGFPPPPNRMAWSGSHPTPLSRATKSKNDRGREEIIRLLLTAGADVNSNFDVTALHEAARSGNVDAAKVLVDAGADVNVKAAGHTEQRVTPLHEAAHNGQIAMCEFLLEKGANINAKDARGNTALHKAVESIGHWAQNNQKEMIEFLLKNGADVNARNLSGETPLNGAQSRPDIAKILIKAGSDVNNINRRKSSPLTDAARVYHAQDFNKGNQRIKLLLKSGAKVNMNELKSSPLHNAALSNNPEAVKLLLDAGANIYAKDDEGNTPLHTAAQHGSADTARLLVKKGSRLSAKNDKERTPLDVARVFHKQEVVEILENQPKRSKSHVSSIDETSRGSTGIAKS